MTRLIPHFCILIIGIILTACNQNGSTTSDSIQADTLNVKNRVDIIKADNQEQITKRLTFENVSEIVSGKGHSTWVELKDSSASLALHFQYKDTLAVSYSPECWLIYPYKLDGNKIVVYWNNYIDTKYDFDIVKAINKTDKKYIGKPFMVLEITNDTTLKAIYPMENLIRKINNSSKDRTFFPKKFVIAQDGYM